MLDVGSNCRAMLAPGLHMFLQENADGIWTLCIENSISISPPWPLFDSLGSASVIVWEPVLSPDWQLWCFFEALGLTSGALCHLPGLRPFLLKRQISGGELCCIASLLLPLLPNGFLLLHSQGSCFHFHGSNPVQSYLSLFLLLPARHSIPCFYGCFNQHNYIM